VDGRKIGEDNERFSSHNCPSFAAQQLESPQRDINPRNRPIVLYVGQYLGRAAVGGAEISVGSAADKREDGNIAKCLVFREEV
jgi:hypothetical protein